MAEEHAHRRQGKKSIVPVGGARDVLRELAVDEERFAV
jgi:hypothetical protein